MLSLFIFLLNLAASTTDHTASQSSIELVNRFLPKGATVETLREFDPKTKSEKKALAAKIGRMSRKGGTYLAFIYTITNSKDGQRLRLRIVGNLGGRPAILDQDLPGGFLWMQDFKTNGFQVADLNGDGVDDILTITSEGASLGGYLNIFAIDSGKLKSILNKPHGYEVDGYRFQLEPGTDNIYRITVFSKDGLSALTLRWNGRLFIR